MLPPDRPNDASFGTRAESLVEKLPRPTTQLPHSFLSSCELLGDGSALQACVLQRLRRVREGGRGVPRHEHVRNPPSSFPDEVRVRIKTQASDERKVIEWKF